MASGGLGCSTTTTTFDHIWSGRTISPGDFVSFTLDRHKVPAAWALTTGGGVTVGVIDTGTSATQPQLTHEFSSGLSAGRTILHDFTLSNAEPGLPGWHDTCRHGTKTAGLIGAPRNGKNIVGVAYNSSVYAVRALDNVNIGWPVETLAVRDAINRASQQADARIINMSFGSRSGTETVANAIRHNYAPPYNVLFIGAAGTEFGIAGAVFPSSMPEVVAVTGLDPNIGHPYRHCSDCNTSDKVELSAFTRGSTTGVIDGEIDGYGGSSAATALTSGIAALVWSRYPHWSREQVVARMKAAAPFASRQRGIGHGPVNAHCAVGGICGGSVQAYSTVYHGQPVTFWGSAFALDADVAPRLTYQWSFGGSGQMVQHVPMECPGETVSFFVQATDPVTGSTERIFSEYVVQDDGSPPIGLCYSEDPGPGQPGPGYGY